MPSSLVAMPCHVHEFIGDFSKHKGWKENADKVCHDEEDIRGKIVIVTGSNTGIGKQAALQLAKREARVIMAIRNLQKGEKALEDIKKQLEGRPLTIELMKLDLGNLQSLRDFVTTFQSKYDHVDILVNNAGYLSTKPVLQKTSDGFEQHIGVNVLGPLLLTRLMLPLLKQSTLTPARVVCVASSNLALASLNFMEDLMMEKKVKKGDSGMEQYNISKLCGALVCYRLAQDPELLGHGRVKLIHLCPGLVNSDLFRGNSNFVNKILVGATMKIVGQTTHQGCETIVYCAVSKGVVAGKESGKGEVYRTKKVWEKGTKVVREYVASPKGSEVTNQLYNLAETLVGLKGKEAIMVNRKKLINFNLE